MIACFKIYFEFRIIFDISNFELLISFLELSYQFNLSTILRDSNFNDLNLLLNNFSFSKIKHNHLYLSIDAEDLINVVLFLKNNKDTNAIAVKPSRSAIMFLKKF